MAVTSSTTAPVAEKRPNPLQVFQRTLERDGLDGRTAQFKDKAVEKRYTKHLVEKTLPGERIVWWMVIAAYFGYAILDVLTVSENLDAVLIVRLVSGLLMTSLMPLSYFERVKPHFGWLSAAAILITALAIIYMISIIPVEGAPPYIIGVLVVFIASSCIMRIPFRVAAGAYLSSSLVYVFLLNVNPAFPPVEVISGHFFMLSIALVAVVTNYTQEIRSRMIWLRDEQRQRDAETIEKLLIEATAADQSKINFLSMMSHELRTPLHQIIGYTEVVTNACKAANDDGDNVRHLNEIHGSAHVLLSRIQKMLRFADATAGKMKYEIAKTPVSELIEVSTEQMRGGLDNKSLTIDTSGLKDEDISIDIVHTCYALNNIIENAITASPQNGTIWISGDKTADGGYNLVVRDNGPGMTPEQIAKALQPFTQGEETLARSREGMGLGLTLASRIFKDQKATISLASNPDGGLSATISFAPPAKKEEAPKETRLAG